MYIKIYSTLIFLLISCSSFFYQKNVDKLDITGVKVTQVFPSLNINGSLEGYDTITAYIYYYRNMNLFKLPYHFTSEVNGVVAKSEIRYHYFVYEDGDNFGYDYDINKYPQGKLISEDSLFENEWIRQTKLYPIISTNNPTLISRHQNKDSGILNEVYSIKGKIDTTLSGTVFLSYTDKIKSIKYSISKELDSITNMKLYKVKIITDERYFKEYNMSIERYESGYWMQEIPANDCVEALTYFNKYKRTQMNDN